MAPETLTEVAGLLANHGDRRLGSTRHIAAAMILRQVLEESLDGLWAAEEPGMASVSMRAQLIVLPWFLEESLAGRVREVWNALSAACHHSAYELAPSRQEISFSIAVIEELAAAVAARARL